MPSKRRDGKVPIGCHLEAEQHAALMKICVELDASKSDVMRRAIREFVQRFDGRPENSVFTGPEEIVASKWKAIELFRTNKGPNQVARLLQVRPSVLAAWLDQDATFNELAQSARHEATEQIDEKLWTLALEGNVKACFGHLNAHDDRYGTISKRYLQTAIRKFIDSVVLPLLRRHLPPEALESVSRELSQGGARLALSGS